MAEVEHVCPGHCRRRQAISFKRRVPFARGAQEEMRDRRGKHIVHQGGARFKRAARILQCEEHRREHERAVLRVPRQRRGAQQQVLDGPCGQGVQAGVDAAGVRLQQRAIGRRAGRDDVPRTCAHAVQPCCSIQRQGGAAHQRGQLAGGTPAREIHLEEPFLRVDEPERAGDVGTRRAADRRHAAVVAVDRHRREETRQTMRPRHLWQAAQQLSAGPQRGSAEYENESAAGYGEAEEQPLQSVEPS